MESLPVHQTQLYEAAMGLLLFGASLWLWRRRRLPGEVLLPVSALYGVWRFAIEGWRDDPDRGFFLALSTSQLLSLALVPLLLWAYRSTQAKPQACTRGLRCVARPCRTPSR
jgi:prolipoprotein diacylglyceryltransferase